YPVLRRSGRVKAFVPALVGTAVLCAWEAWTWALTGKPHLWTSLHAWAPHKSAGQLSYFIYSEVIHLGAQLPWRLAATLLFIPWKKAWSLLGVALLLCGLATFTLFTKPQSSLPMQLFFAFPGALVVLYTSMVLLWDAVAWVKNQLTPEHANRALLILW